MRWNNKLTELEHNKHNSQVMCELMITNYFLKTFRCDKFTVFFKLLILFNTFGYHLS